jgi:predicted DCC family thiol-disulfide oxidoreductase YuxK
MLPTEKPVTPRPEPKAWIIYDGQCPFCSRYVEIVRLRDSLGRVELVDAREGGPIVDEAISAGLDLDDGMVLKIGDRFYHGDECVHMLALLSTPSGGLQPHQRRYFPLPDGLAPALPAPSRGPQRHPAAPRADQDEPTGA